MIVYLLAISSGILTSIFWRVYIRATDRNQAGRAFMGDYGLMLLGTFIQQLWAVHGDNVSVLLVYDTVAAGTTYVVNKYGRMREMRKGR